MIGRVGNVTFLCLIWLWRAFFAAFSSLASSCLRVLLLLFIFALSVRSFFLSLFFFLFFCAFSIEKRSSQAIKHTKAFCAPQAKRTKTKTTTTGRAGNRMRGGVGGSLQQQCGKINGWQSTSCSMNNRTQGVGVYDWGTGCC